MALLQSSLPPLCPNSVQIQPRRSRRSAENHGLISFCFSRQAAKAQRGFLEGRPPCRPGNPNIQNATNQGLTPFQVGRILWMSRAVGCGCPAWFSTLWKTIFHTVENPGSAGIHHRRTSALPCFSTNDQRRTTKDHCPQLFSISIPHATDDGGMTP